MTHQFTVWRYASGGWTKDGKPVSSSPPQRRPCTHEGPCRFPFRKCDGGTCYSKEEVSAS